MISIFVVCVEECILKNTQELHRHAGETKENIAILSRDAVIPRRNSDISLLNLSVKPFIYFFIYNNRNHNMKQTIHLERHTAYLICILLIKCPQEGRRNLQYYFLSCQFAGTL